MLKEKKVYLMIMTCLYGYSKEQAEALFEAQNFIGRTHMEAHNVALIGEFKELFPHDMPAIRDKYLLECIDAYNAVGKEYLRLYRGLPVTKDMCMAFYKSQRVYALYALAQNPHTPKDILAKLVETKNMHILLALANNKNTPVNTLAEISHVYRIDEVIGKRIEERDFDERALSLLHSHGKSSLDVSIAKVTTSHTLLTQLFAEQGEVEEVIHSLIANPAMPIDLMEKGLENNDTKSIINKALLKRKDGIRILESMISEKTDLSVLLSLAKSKKITEDGVQKLLGLQCYPVNCALLNNQNLADEIKDKIMLSLEEYDLEMD